MASASAIRALKAKIMRLEVKVVKLETEKFNWIKETGEALAAIADLALTVRRKKWLAVFSIGKILKALKEVGDVIKGGSSGKDVKLPGLWGKAFKGIE